MIKAYNDLNQVFDGQISSVGIPQALLKNYMFLGHACQMGLQVHQRSIGKVDNRAASQYNRNHCSLSDDESSLIAYARQTMISLPGFMTH
jgi:hypothetical protein